MSKTTEYLETTCSQCEIDLNNWLSRNLTKIYLKSFIALSRNHLLLPVPRDHLLDDHPRYVHICERRKAVVEHVFGQPRVTAAHHENVVVLAHILRYPILESGVALGGGRGEGRGGEPIPEW